MIFRITKPHSGLTYVLFSRSPRIMKQFLNSSRRCYWHSKCQGIPLTHLNLPSIKLDALALVSLRLYSRLPSLRLTDCSSDAHRGEEQQSQKFHPSTLHQRSLNGRTIITMSILKAVHTYRSWVCGMNPSGYLQMTMFHFHRSLCPNFDPRPPKRGECPSFLEACRLLGNCGIREILLPSTSLFVCNNTLQRCGLAKRASVPRHLQPRKFFWSSLHSWSSPFIEAGATMLLVLQTFKSTFKPPRNSPASEHQSVPNHSPSKYTTSPMFPPRGQQRR